MIGDLLLVAFTSAVSTIPISYLVHRWLGPKSPHRIIRDTCTGYTTESGTLFDDCRSDRSVTCLDGRCTFHCRQMCKCEASNEPEYIGRSRS